MSVQFVLAVESQCSFSPDKIVLKSKPPHIDVTYIENAV